MCTERQGEQKVLQLQWKCYFWKTKAKYGLKQNTSLDKKNVVNFENDCILIEEMYKNLTGFAVKQILFQL